MDFKALLYTQANRLQLHIRDNRMPAYAARDLAEIAKAICDLADKVEQAEHDMAADIINLSESNDHLHDAVRIESEAATPSFDPAVMAELVTMSDSRLARLAGQIIEEFCNKPCGIPHVGAMNRVVEEAARRTLHRFPEAFDS